MKIKEWFEREYVLKYYEIKGIIILAILSTLLLISIWPNYNYNALESNWLFLVILIVIFLIIGWIWKKFPST